MCAITSTLSHTLPVCKKGNFINWTLHRIEVSGPGQEYGIAFLSSHQVSLRGTGASLIVCTACYARAPKIQANLLQHEYRMFIVDNRCWKSSGHDCSWRMHKRSTSTADIPTLTKNVVILELYSATPTVDHLSYPAGTCRWSNVEREGRIDVIGRRYRTPFWLRGRGSEVRSEYCWI